MDGLFALSITALIVLLYILSIKLKRVIHARYVASERGVPVGSDGQAEVANLAPERDDRIQYHWDIMTAGVSYEGRYKVVEKHVYEGEDCLLVREINHPRDKHAVQIHTLNGHMVGYVPKEYAEQVSEYLNDGRYLYNAYFSRIIEKGKHPIPCVQIRVYLSSAQIDDYTLRQHRVIQYKLTRKQRSSRKKGGSSWVTWLILILILWWWLS